MSNRTVNLGGGQVVPYPEPTSEAASSIGHANRRVGTGPELQLRRELHRLGLRFRVDPLVRAGAVRTHPDLMFGPVRLAVFVDGCFWHVCPVHFHHPKTNLAYWGPKLKANTTRDRRVDLALKEAGWNVLRIWEHVPVDQAVALVLSALTALRHPAAMRVTEVPRALARPR